MRQPLVYLAVYLVAAFGCRGEQADSALAARCRADGDTLRTIDVEVRVGSSLSATSQLVPGRLGACTDAPGAITTFLRAIEVMSTIPAELRPDRLTIHHAPRLPAGARPLEDLEAHHPSRGLLASGADVAIPIWLHELAHVRMSETASRAARSNLLDALEEGVADYYAATLAGTPQLPARDLTSPPRLLPDDWAALAFEPFDPHRLGWSFAASLWRVEPRAGALLEDLLACFVAAPSSETTSSSRSSIERWLAGCPPRSRDAIERHLCGWLPRELHPRCA